MFAENGQYPAEEQLEPNFLGSRRGSSENGKCCVPILLFPGVDPKEVGKSPCIFGQHSSWIEKNDLNLKFDVQHDDAGINKQNIANIYVIIYGTTWKFWE